MKPFTTLTAIAAPLLRDNVDTDAIIPSREMRSVSKKGLADGLFAGWRYVAIGSREPQRDFVLNRPRYAGARILVSGANFGCGSSREHAVWALAEFGIRAVVAPSFNPIFQANCIANGVVPVLLDRDVVAVIAAALEDAASPHLTVDLDAQTVSLDHARVWHFEIDPDAREALLAGRDSIAQTLQLADQIAAFRARDAVARAWIYTSVERTRQAITGDPSS
ncbi:3-isopropylmalate dehydratase small subunit [Sphingomonas sp. MMSM20]|uniref:3-isopropylmalate dehydratase small subunit n=1 Tax=Sphingomonas lycopersici TaxID=2951807 RepID=UPI002238265C|nr:3-isopropylmalate dehydratase small subunit [Sphingomonas lycopersici]MCW6528818.1 3-isopropylmalate dehydratase small subunit [Sphingomonas lycopersici]